MLGCIHKHKLSAELLVEMEVFYTLGISERPTKVRRPSFVTVELDNPDTKVSQAVSFTEFTQGTTFHGISYIFRPSSSQIRRFVKELVNQINYII